MNNKQWLGIDVSKDELKIACFTERQWQLSTCPNTLLGIVRWMKTLQKQVVHIVLEATGAYSSKLVWMLHEQGIRFSVITPRQSSQFAGVLKNITKNDERDACCLALFGQHMQPAQYEMPLAAVEQLRQIRTLVRQLKKQRRALSNQRHAFEQLPNPLPTLLQSIDQTLAHLDEQIAKLENQSGSLARSTFDELIRRAMTIKGIGEKTATALIVATNGLQHFEDVKQLSKFAGLAPTQCQSGTSVRGKGHIHRAADPELRSLLYIASWSALRSNRACIELHKRLRAKGKPPKVALIAVAHKLLRQIWAVVKNGTVFDNDFECATASA